jgi:hypothetical protein
MDWESCGGSQLSIPTFTLFHFIGISLDFDEPNERDDYDPVYFWRCNEDLMKIMSRVYWHQLNIMFVRLLHLLWTSGTSRCWRNSADKIHDCITRWRRYISDHFTDTYSFTFGTGQHFDHPYIEWPIKKDFLPLIQWYGSDGPLSATWRRRREVCWVNIHRKSSNIFRFHTVDMSAREL